ncbi:polysaccharide deacetylase family protein [Pseudomonas sp. DTU_2021_1001937_2_SI_NGA_ILE_001]|uniref:polysaccharide deacetylase family protein n=1 Tax=Pseudomonas sp. DTU_2021_1001937_2_SI_NGA_ILE_001 TaxID=3077589 RepID=UPI0028FC139A|nr:polysaccharide deacetylase family protein [Pseudomonas sp. DTU_2021_1001937_2_SI_NGA_ILE_001]WNW11631.1 polysaccharide deacetylase family protein [Pseudomonas sp. DTU_2021_1001937_2_SI_NGA_ILE_001]
MAERPPARPPAVLLVLHDVAPCSWQAYLPLLQALDERGSIPLTWLVVPNFHRQCPLDSDPALLRLLDRRLALGDELVLHGRYHCDDGPAPRTPVDYLRRRIYTHEGEFQPLSQAQALTHLDAGIELFRQHAWPLYGFVAPGWLMGVGTRQALRQRPLQYTSDRRHFYRLPTFTPEPAPSLVWSARSAWRRGASRVWCEWQQRQWRQAPVIRLGLHPVDMQHASARQYWLKVLDQLLAEGRQALTKRDWLFAQADSSSSVLSSLPLACN